MTVRLLTAVLALAMVACAPTNGPVPPVDTTAPAMSDVWEQLAVFDASIDGPVVVTDRADLVTLWSGLGGGDPPSVDFNSSVVFAVEIGYSGSCPDTELEEVAVGPERVAFHVVTVTDATACTDDYNPRVYVASVRRSELPAPPFRLGWSAAPPLQVEITEDLRVP